ncbi:hypothetical protein M413DRAFT_31352 [Hebeloma cylindrosporum]|uniref:Tyrosinase copper-binding domain-containing protein n=1 Tax=Hebeloma cylindrosporum TaxID=76867 RepID=A0A0C3BJQ5_HEBCY|nr:hypothetical protein M413DRAFT_31352 [Hebeloma cylindrosporum h7]
MPRNDPRADEYAPDRQSCETLLERREWRTLSATEKADYIAAIQCLQSLPSLNTTVAAAKSRFDEFQAYHIEQADNGIHVTGQFLPWHRHYLRTYELALKNECGYQGTHPYWAWEQDVSGLSSIANSPVFDPITGFGGDGVPGTYSVPPDANFTLSKINPAAFKGCVGDGPFKDYVLHFGPGKLVTDHCLTRGIQDDYAEHLTSAAMANATQQPTFELFRVELEGIPFSGAFKMHDSGHLSVGGEMSNFYSSPGGELHPLFFLHHANLDRVWWTWQTMLPQRLYEISGRSTLDPPYQNVTLDTPLQMSASLGPTVPIRDVMDIWSEPNCYTYV